MCKLIAVVVLAGMILGLNCTLGIDVSQLFSVENYTCAKNNGISFGIVRGYCSFGGMDHNAVQSLKNMKMAGLETDVYMFPCRGKNAIAQVNEMMSSIPESHYKKIWVDIETNPSPGCSWKDFDTTSNCQFTMDLLSQIKANGKPAGIYASRHMWAAIFGSETNCYQAATGVPLWYPHYDNNPSYNDFQAFGGWKTPSIKQYQGTTNICGASVDRNWTP